MWQDLKHSARMLVKNPGFTFVAIVSIAIGVGANAAMFSVADGLVMRPLPVPRAAEMVTVTSVLPAGVRNLRLSYPDYENLRDQTRSFDGLVAYTLATTTFVTRPDEPAQRRIGMAVSGNYFDPIQIRPALGRWFRPDEDQAEGRNPVIVLDHDEWQQRFAADPTIIDRRIKVGNVDFTVIGVAPDGFTSIDHDLHPAFYVPGTMLAAIQDGIPSDWRTQRAMRIVTVMGRLKSGVPMTQARQDVQQIAANLERSYPETNRNRGLTVQTPYEAFIAGSGGTDARLVAMLMLLAIVVLIVACANVAGLLTSRAPARAREISLRLAVGGSRFRLIRQLVTESLLVAAGGGALGLLLGYGVIAMFQRIEYPTDIPLKLTFALDTRALVVGIVVAAAAAILSSLVPAWQATRLDLVSAIKDPTATANRRQRLWGRSLLVGGQVALSLVLLTVSVFLYRSFQNELSRGPGFRTDHLLMVTFEPGLARYDANRSNEFYRLLKEKTLATPGVTNASIVSAVPIKAGDLGFALVAPEGFTFREGPENVGVPSADVDEHYFDTIGIRILSGRGFHSTDTMDRPRVAVVNKTFADHYWPGQSAVGKRVRLDNAGRTYAEVVGVAANSKYFFIIESPTEFIYLSQMQGAARRATLLVGTQNAAAGLAGPMRDVVRAIDPNMPVFGVRTFEDFYASRVIYTTNLIVGSVSGMGSMGLLLALVGLYGLVAYNASRRTREIGIRMAVGANPGSVLRMVLRHGLTLATGGLAVGLIASIAANNLLRASFASSPIGRLDVAAGSDWLVYVQTVLASIVVVMLATYFPARRAARTNPLTALRTE